MSAIDVDGALATLADTPNLLIALDFDGTLAPLEDEPMSARMLPAARAAVDRLAALPDTSVALISGRSLGDLRVVAEHGEDSHLLLAGSHGAEHWLPGEGAVETSGDPAASALLERLFGEAERLVVDLPGVWIEPKTFGFGVHTRTADAASSEEAQRVVDELVATEAPGWRRRTGQNIVEYAFRHEGKDAAVAVLRERTGATAVLFAGDDVTDEDALRSLSADDLGVHVGDNETAADISVPDITAFARLLDALAGLRVARAE